MSELKVYSIDGGEYWFAAKSEKEAIEEYHSEYGEPIECIDIKELSKEELNETHYYHDYDGSELSITFKERLNELMEKGVSGPIHFATSLDNI